MGVAGRYEGRDWLLKVGGRTQVIMRKQYPADVRLSPARPVLGRERNGGFGKRKTSKRKLTYWLKLLADLRWCGLLRARKETALTVHEADREARARYG